MQDFNICCSKWFVNHGVKRLYTVIGLCFCFVCFWQLLSKALSHLEGAFLVKSLRKFVA